MAHCNITYNTANGMSPHSIHQPILIAYILVHTDECLPSTLYLQMIQAEHKQAKNAAFGELRVFQDNGSVDKQVNLGVAVNG